MHMKETMEAAGRRGYEGNNIEKKKKKNKPW
jgi:hypothetical protein